MNILVTGGAGYVGSILCRRLLEFGHQVTILDRFQYGIESILPIAESHQVTLIQGDIRDTKLLGKSLRNQDVIIHLAAIVGYPACDQDPVAAFDINFQATSHLNNMRSSDQRVIFASTSSVYGRVLDGTCTERTPANPLTIYGRTKKDAEDVLLSKGNALVYRFSTAFGVSPRLRLDLMVNDFCYRAVKEHSIVLYEGDTIRPFIHVWDMSQALLIGLHRKHMDGVYNVGSSDLHATKRELAEMINKHHPFQIIEGAKGTDKDQRNYVVDFSKIEGEGFVPANTLDSGIQQLLKVIKVYNPVSRYTNVGY